MELTTFEYMCAVPAPFYLLPISLPDIGKEQTFSIKKVSDIFEKDWRHLRKIEAFHSASGLWVEIHPKHMKRLKEFNVTEKKLNQLLDLWWKRFYLTEGHFLNEFIEKLFEEIDRLPISNSKKMREFWDFCKFYQNDEIALLSTSETCLPSKLSKKASISLILRSLEPNKNQSLLTINWLGRLSEISQVCVRKFSSFTDFCSQTIEITKSRITKFLVIDAHGDASGIRSFPDPKKSITLFHSLQPCLQFLQKNASLILHTCSAGNGKSLALNFANHAANSSPKGVHIIAPTSGFHELVFDPRLPAPHGAIYLDRSNRQDRDTTTIETYHIDTEKISEETCPKDAISPLDICSNFPLIRPIDKEDDSSKVNLQFYSHFRSAWFDITSSIHFFIRRGFNNEHLEIISKSELLPYEFVIEAMKHPDSLTPDELIFSIFSS